MSSTQVSPTGADQVAGAAPGPARTPTHADVRGRLLTDPAARHVITIPARQAVAGHWPVWLDARVRAALIRSGVTTPWRHQQQAAEAAWSGTDIGLVTGTASGKSLAYTMPGLTAVLEPPQAAGSRGDCVLYLAPTKALAQDQLGKLRALELDGLRAATYDGDTPTDERAWARAHARWLISNPDMVHRSLLPGHARWRSFLRNLRLVVIDEAHAYRGVFGAHVGLVLRRLLRLCSRYGTHPTVIATSATTADPQDRLERLTGRPVQVIGDDCSARAATELVFWSQPVEPDSGEQPRRGVIAESAAIMSELIRSQRQTLVFARSRRGAEALAGIVRDSQVAPGRVAAYRGGYLPEERRALEADLRSGALAGMAATNALELGIDISGLDAVVMAGWPGSRASFWQQSGRAGRRGQDSLVFMVAREDPLDQYLIGHPEAVVGEPLETGTFSVSNPYVLAPHLAAAAAESPLADDEVSEVFGPTAPEVARQLAERGLLRRRRSGWFWTSNDDPTALTDLRGSAGAPVRLVEEGTGKLLGTVDRASAPSQVHPGAVYVHQGRTYVILELALEDRVAMAIRGEVDYDTTARSLSSVSLGPTSATKRWGDVVLSLQEVEVRSQVTSYLKRRWPSGEVLGEFPLAMPPSCLPTTAAVISLTDEFLCAARIDEAELAGALHAAEHAAIALLPLIATCDRWDIGGVSLPSHPDTGTATIVIYDGAAGGAGFAESGFRSSRRWIEATAQAIASCGCERGCPSCVHSPKCGNGNNPLDKAAALRLLQTLLSRMTVDTETQRDRGDQGVDAKIIYLPVPGGAGASAGNH